MDFQIERIVRHPGLDLLIRALLTAISCSSMGCWKEVRYEPNQTDQAAHRAAPTEDQTEIQMENQTGQTVTQKQTLDTNAPAPEQPEKSSANRLPEPADATLSRADESIQAIQETSPKEKGPVEKEPIDEDPVAETPSDKPLLDSLFPNDLPTSPQPAYSPPKSSSESSSMAKSVKTETGGAPIAVPKPSRTAQAAWQLGSQWSLGAAIYAKGLPTERYEPSLEQAATAAQMLGLELTPLPNVAANKNPVASVVTYLLDDQGPSLAGKLNQQYDARHAALMELAIQSHMLLLVYSPRNMAQGRGLLGTEQFQAWVDRLAELAGSSCLPELVWNPLLDGLRRQAPYTEVKQAVFKLHKQVAAELASGS